jgi:hypothetical protein
MTSGVFSTLSDSEYGTVRVEVSQAPNDEVKVTLSSACDKLVFNAHQVTDLCNTMNELLAKFVEIQPKPLIKSVSEPKPLRKRRGKAG